MKKFRAIFSELSNAKDKEQHEILFDAPNWQMAIQHAQECLATLQVANGKPYEIRLIMREIGT